MRWLSEVETTCQADYHRIELVEMPALSGLVLSEAVAVEVSKPPLLFQ